MIQNLGNGFIAAYQIPSIGAYRVDKQKGFCPPYTVELWQIGSMHQVVV